MERGDGWGVEDERGALGEATGHEEASAGDCGEFWGGNGEGEVALCMGHPGLNCQLVFLKPCIGIAHWGNGI